MSHGTTHPPPTASNNQSDNSSISTENGYCKSYNVNIHSTINYIYVLTTIKFIRIKSKRFWDVNITKGNVNYRLIAAKKLLPVDFVTMMQKIIPL